MTLADGAALAVGTLTRIPVPPPRTVDRAVAGIAMVLAPVIGAVLGIVVGGAAQLTVDHTGGGPLLAAALAVAAIAYLTRALHLDGLADTADAVGSGRPAEQALAIAKRSDVGPFGVATVLLVLLVQTAALAELLAAGQGALGLAVALGSGRLAITVACVRGVPAARPDGLGAAVAQSVSRIRLTLAAVAWTAVCAAGAFATGDGRSAAVAAVGAVAVALAAGAVLLRVCVRRLGGVTGDVLGAVCEAGATAALVLLVVASA
jgi:adenosylcobinamide-GDP ribazoletransferase